MTARKIKEESYLSAEELAERWGIHPRTLANWRSLGKGPSYIKMGERRSPVRYPLSKVLKFEKENFIE